MLLLPLSTKRVKIGIMFKRTFLQGIHACAKARPPANTCLTRPWGSRHWSILSHSSTIRWYKLLTSSCIRYLSSNLTQSPNSLHAILLEDEIVRCLTNVYSKRPISSWTIVGPLRTACYKGILTYSTSYLMRKLDKKLGKYSFPYLILIFASQ